MKEHDTLYDVLGVGFGPSNLALAIALDDVARERGSWLTCRFLERQERFAWHGGMLLPDSTMQIAFIKDLVCLRDPTSPYTFINYLHKKGRLESFLNRKTFYPSRVEFNDYLLWVASRFEDRCTYGEEVITIEPEAAGGVVTALRVRSRDPSGTETIRHTRNLVLAPGGEPFIPPVFTEIAGNPRTVHSAGYLARVSRLAVDGPRAPRIAVVGGGQSAVEITVDLHGRFPTAVVDTLFHNHALRPADDTPFVNEIFDASFTDPFFHQSDEAKAAFIAEFRNTNYAVIDVELIRRLYDIVYEQKVTGHQRVSLHGRSRITAAAADQDGITFRVLDERTRHTRQCRYDAVILATGYDRDARHPLLSTLEPYLESYALDRHYRLPTRPDFRPHVFIQGFSEASHGLSDTLLSVLPARSREIAESLFQAASGTWAPPLRRPAAAASVGAG